MFTFIKPFFFISVYLRVRKKEWNTMEWEREEGKIKNVINIYLKLYFCKIFWNRNEMAPTAAAASKKRTHINYNSYFVSIENEKENAMSIK